jgi:peroxiredoxin
MLFSRQLGSLREGPEPGEMAPDFSLPAMDGTGKVTLSASRGKRPVVLIFGSFT